VRETISPGVNERAVLESSGIDARVTPRAKYGKRGTEVNPREQDVKMDNARARSGERTRARKLATPSPQHVGAYPRATGNAAEMWRRSSQVPPPKSNLHVWEKRFFGEETDL
jgi:hypothetical protein